MNQEFQQNDIKIQNTMQKCSVQVKKAFSAEQKIRDLKKLFKSQRTEKRWGKKVKTNYLVKKQLII